MTEAPHRPFPDLVGPPRTDQQKADDEARNKEQTDRLEADAVPDVDQTSSVSQAGGTIDDQGMDDLDRLLFERRKGARTAVPLGTLQTTTEQWSVVVPGQLIARVTLPLREASGIGGNSPFEAVKQPGSSSVCPELQGLMFLVYKEGIDEENSEQRDKRNVDVKATMTALNNLSQPGDEVKAAPRLVAALQKVIVKAAIGPAPTTVDTTQTLLWDAFREAGLHEPTREVIVAVIDTGITDVHRDDGWLNEVDRSCGTRRRARGPTGSGQRSSSTSRPGTAPAPPGSSRCRPRRGHPGLPGPGQRRLRGRDRRRLRDDPGVDEGGPAINLSFGMQTVDGRPSVALELALKVILEKTDDENGR